MSALVYFKLHLVPVQPTTKRDSTTSRRSFSTLLLKTQRFQKYRLLSTALRWYLKTIHYFFLKSISTNRYKWDFNFFIGGG